MFAFTDMSISNKETYHSFVLYDNHGDIIKKCVEKSHYKDTITAENYSIKILLDYCKMNSYKKILIFTDSKFSSDIIQNNPEDENFSKEISDFLKESKSEVKWISRNYNTVAHKLCYLARKNKIDISNLRLNKNKIIIYEYKLKKKYLPQEKFLIYFSKNTLPPESYEKTYNYYCLLIKESYRLDISEFYKQVNKLDIKSVDSIRGRKHLVLLFILKYHDIESEFNPDLIKIFFTKIKLDETIKTQVDQTSIFQNVIHYIKYYMFKVHYLIPIYK